MPVRHVTDEPLLPELESIAAAAADELRAIMDEDHEGEQPGPPGVPAAASAAIAAGIPLAAVAEAERVGQTRARRELGSDVLRRIERAARRKREADDEYQHAIVRAGRLGLTHREIAAAAHIAHGTVRAIIARGDGRSGDDATGTVGQDRDASEPAHL